MDKLERFMRGEGGLRGEHSLSRYQSTSLLTQPGQCREEGLFKVYEVFGNQDDRGIHSGGIELKFRRLEVILRSLSV